MNKRKTFTNRRYLDALEDHLLVYDGAMGTSIQSYNLSAEDFGGQELDGNNDWLVMTRPDVIEEIHASFFAVGCEVVETNTFRGNRLTQAEYGVGDRALELNRTAAQLARRVADRFEQETGMPRFVAGSIGPTGKLPSSDEPDLSNITFEELADIFYEQAQGLVEGGADVLVIETSQDILEVKAAIVGINRYFEDSQQRIPLQVQVTLDTSGRMLLGTDIASALATLEALPVDVIGLNCSTGPEHMREPIKYLVEHSRLPISVLPNAGLPLNVDGQAVYPMEPDPYAHMMHEFAEWGVSVVGGCCGTTPEHMSRLITAVGDRSKHTPQRLADDNLPRISSGMRATNLVQDPPPALIGERVNSQGSRKIKQLLLEDDFDGILAVAREQVDGGAHMLDVCVALTERDDEADLMATLVKKLSMSIEVPLVIDTTEANVLEAAFANYPGRGVVNSINLENGRERIDRVLPIALKYGAALIALTIDEAGMAKTVERKVEIARAIHDIVVGEYGLAPEDLIFDTLTFTLATGDAEFNEAAVATIDSIRRIKAELPGVLTSLGVSNVSFGLGAAARHVLNSVFLYHCVQAGLDMAIVNPKHIKPYAEIPEEQRELANDLIFYRREDALARYIQYFEENEVAAGEEEVDPTEGMTAEEKIHWQILHRKKEGVEDLIDETLTRHEPVEVLNTVLLPAMKEVGDKFGAGELILPFVLQSAEVMKKCVAYLEQFFDRVEGTTKGTVVLATVYGDVHDIGKNLVKTILSNNGYTVHDLGKQVPANVIIDAAVEHQADAIGLSALLVSTSRQMPLIVNELARRGLSYPVLIGGAAINRRFGQRILFLEETGEPYAPGVFYCKDAFEGLDAVDNLVDDGRREDFVNQLVTSARVEKERAEKSADTPAQPKAGQRNVPLLTAEDIPTPPFWGTKTIEYMPLEMVFQHIHKPELFRLSWGAKNTHGPEWTKLEAEFEKRLASMQRAAIREKALQPRAVYGYFPGQSDGDDLVIYDPEPFNTSNGDQSELREIARLSFPRQPEQFPDRLCISDYFAPVGSGVVDVVTLQVVTVGAGATERFDAVQAEDNYSEAYFFHGLAVQTAEATAEYTHQHIRRELGLDDKRGKRYSWGYPACPELDDHAVVFKLLPAEAELGMTLTSAFQLVPEQSTAAIVVHHPQASYYSVGVGRTEQLLAEGARQEG